MEQNNNNKNGFILYHDQREFFERLPPEDAKELILAIFDYEQTREPPEFTSQLAELSFVAFRNTLDRNRQKHEEISQKRSEVGRKGALAKHGKSGNCQQSLAKPGKGVAKVGKAADTDTESDTDTDTDNTPQTPQGGKSPSRMTETEKKRRKVKENTELMKRIGSWFGRQPDTLWSIYEAEALEQIDPPENVVKGLEYFYTAEIADEEDFRRKSIATLLNNWTGEVDKAREFARKQKQQKGKLNL